MATKQIRISEELFNQAQNFSAIHTRSVNQQVEHWAKLGKLAEANPLLPYHVIQESLIGIEQAEAGELEVVEFEDL